MREPVIVLCDGKPQGYNTRTKKFFPVELAEIMEEEQALRCIVQTAESGMDFKTIPVFLSPEQHNERSAWESRNAYRFEEDFQKTQEQGSAEFSMKFIKAQEAAISAISGGIFPPFNPATIIKKAMVSRLVLAVLRVIK